jgi:DNA-binding protein YbaB
LTQNPDFLENISKFAEQVQSVVNSWQKREFTGAADEDRIVARVNAIGALTAIDIHLLSKRRLNNVSLGEAITSAVNAAEEAAKQGQSELMDAIQIGDRTMGAMWRENLRTAEEWGGIPPQ